MTIIKELVEAAAEIQPRVEDSDPFYSKNFKFAGGDADEQKYICKDHGMFLMFGREVGLSLKVDFELHRYYNENDFGDGGFQCNVGASQITSYQFMDDNEEPIDGTNVLRMSGGIAQVERVIESYLNGQASDMCEAVSDQDYREEADEDTAGFRRRR